MAYPVTTEAFLYPSTTVVMCCDVEGDTHPPPLSHPFCLQSEQSLSPQHIAMGQKWVI